MLTGKELFARYGAEVLGPWEDQPADVQEAWENIAKGVRAELWEIGPGDAPAPSDCPSPLGTVCKDPACPVHFGRGR